MRQIFLISILSFFLFDRFNANPLPDITPVPIDRFNPQLTEFRRMDTSNDEKITFTEFLLADKDYIEARSREFHAYDKNKDGIVSRAEFEAYYDREDRDRHHGAPDLDHDSFFSDRPGFHHFFPSTMHHMGREHEGPKGPGTHSQEAPSAPFYRHLNSKNSAKEPQTPRHRFFFF